VRRVDHRDEGAVRGPGGIRRNCQDYLSAADPIFDELAGSLRSAFAECEPWSPHGAQLNSFLPGVDGENQPVGLGDFDDSRVLQPLFRRLIDLQFEPANQTWGQ
jgi:hypothetical protein